jgi:flagellar hook assembly protein FlgD
MSSYTYFVYEDNFDGSTQDVTIDIYNTSGCLVTEIKTEVTPSGYSSGPMFWDGSDNNGNKICRGIYFYRITVRSKDQTTISSTQKLLVIN